MEFRRFVVLRGPNLWAPFPVVEAWIDLGHWNDVGSDEVPGFNERLMAWLPGLIEHRCSVGERGGFLQRLRRGTYPAHILEHISLELQGLAGSPVRFGRARSTGEDRLYRVALEYEQEDLARASLVSARDLFLAAMDDRPFDVGGEVTRLQEVRQTARPDALTWSWVEAARKRDIPVRLNGDDRLTLGWGDRRAVLDRLDPDEDPSAALERLFPGGDCGRFPVVAVAGAEGAAEVTRLVASMLERSGRRVGAASSEGVRLAGQWAHRGDATGTHAVQSVLDVPNVEGAVFEAGLRAMVREGLGFERCDVGVVLNVGEGDDPDLPELESPDRRAQCLRTVVRTVLENGTAVLNGDDPRVVELGEDSPGRVTWFTQADDPESLRASLRPAGPIVALRGGEVVVSEDGSASPLVSWDEAGRPGPGAGLALLLAAAAAGLAAGVEPAVIRETLRRPSSSV